MSKIKRYPHFLCILILFSGCIPVYINLGGNSSSPDNQPQQHSKSLADTYPLRIADYVCPLIIDEQRFDSLATPRFLNPANTGTGLHPTTGHTYHGTLNNRAGYIENCKCIERVEIIDHKLTLIHSHAGGADGDREQTTLLWNGKHYRNSQGEVIADVIIDSPPSMMRVLIIEPKTFDIAPLKAGANGYIWIHLVGYNQLIRYLY